MELRHLRYFVAVAEELNFGRAALRLHMAQSPLSRQIQQLEGELGFRLFHRTKRRVTLTEPGKIFLDRVQLILQQLEQAANLARLADEGKVGHIAVGFVGSAAPTILADILRAFRGQFPTVRLTLLEMRSADQIAALQEERIDVGLLRPMPVSADIELTPLLREPMTAALYRDHPLAGQSMIPLSSLANEPIVRYGVASDARAPAWYEFIQLCQAKGFTPRVVQDANAMLTVLGLVAAGVGIALVPASAARIHVPNVTFRKVNPPAMPTLELDVATNHRSEASAAVLAFKRVLLETMATRAKPG